MLNVHLGAPGVVPDLLATLAACEPVRSAEDLYFVSSTEYRELFQGLVNARARSGPPDSETLRGIRELVHLASGHETVAISQPNFFGYPTDALRSRKSFPLAEARVGRLSGLVSSCEMTFHLVITSQIDYILKMRRMSAADRLSAIRDAAFSWSELVFRIRRGAPERRVVVWDFDLPKATAIPFVETMLGIEASGITQHVLKAISRELTPAGSGPIDYADASLARAVARLDTMYEQDLDDLERMEGVTLVRHEMIPRDLHL
jgi:hypothetical protein